MMSSISATFPNYSHWLVSQVVVASCGSGVSYQYTLQAVFEIDATEQHFESFGFER